MWRIADCGFVRIRAVGDRLFKDTLATMRSGRRLAHSDGRAASPVSTFLIQTPANASKFGWTHRDVNHRNTLSHNLIADSCGLKRTARKYQKVRGSNPFGRAFSVAVRVEIITVRRGPS